MNVFCDTSAFYAIGSAGDSHHHRAVQIWQALALGKHDLVTTNYTVVEAISVIQRRYGLNAVRAFLQSVSGNVIVKFVDRDLHEAALNECLHGRGRRVSFVDHVSFAFMHRNGIDTAFTFDAHFTEYGFKEFSP